MFTFRTESENSIKIGVPTRKFKKIKNNKIAVIFGNGGYFSKFAKQIFQVMLKSVKKIYRFPSH